MSKKKLLIVTDNFLPRWDGISRFLSEILPELKRKYDITVIAPKFKGKWKGIKGVKIKRIPLYNWHFGDFPPAKFRFKEIKKYVRETDLVWVQSLGPIGVLGLICGKLFKKTVIAYTHSLEAELVSKSIGKGAFLRKVTFVIVKYLSRFLYNRCDLLLVPSLDMTEILSWYKIKTKKAVIRLGVDSDDFKPCLDKVKAKEKLGIGGSFVIGYTGRISHEKDLLTLYRAFLRIRKKHNVKLLIVGDGVPKLREYLEKKKNVIVPGSTSDVLKYLHVMDVYVMPSLTETSSLSTMEAMVTGLPVISTPVGHLKNYIEENYNGFFFPQKNAYALSKKINTLIEDPMLRKMMGSNARNTMLEKYDWKDSVDKIKQIIDAMIDK